MPLSWNEIKNRALAFSKQWADAHYEDGQAKPFLIDFFEVFGITNKRIASFEHNVKKYGGKDGYVDLFWPGILQVEMKSRGKNLDHAYTQALDKAVDAAYGYKGAATDAARVAFLFKRYQQITSLLPVTKAAKTRKQKA